MELCHKVRDTVGKKRGLYTSCMQRPDEAQLKAWAKMAEIEKAEAEKIKAEKAIPDHALAQKSEPENKKVIQMPLTQPAGDSPCSRLCRPRAGRSCTSSLRLLTRLPDSR